MPDFVPAPLDAQRQRWLRPDWQRWMRPDWQRWMPPGSAHQLLIKPQACTTPRADADLAHLLMLRRGLDRLAIELADVQAELAARSRADCLKAGFRQDQPRWPGGSGVLSGRWSGGAGTDAAGNAAGTGSTRGGHHFVNKALYKKLPLQPETRKVFEDAETGPLQGGPHVYDREHRVYNEAVAESLDRFLQENGIAPAEMTPDQARKFVDQIKRSSDPRIRTFNQRIYMREIMYWLRRAPLRGNE